MLIHASFGAPELSSRIGDRHLAEEEHMAKNSAPAIPADETAPVDLAHLHRYTLGNAALDKEVLDLFRQTAPGYLDGLRSADESKAWVEAAHALKGSARAIGAWKVGLIAERLERLPGGPAGVEKPGLIEELAAALAVVDRFIAVLPAPD
ncbi:MAG: Hpt domain-containing protein [Hyphomicrobiaceae bacterium]|nr:MAG: Hpt domain-containing protein [Hyphomicrobiaceae bacterium]